MDDLIGKVIDNYVIQEIIGQGGMGVVYRGYHPALQRYSAIKVMRPELVEQPDSYERFLQEARTAARLNHPNIVDVLNFGRCEDSYYLMMDYVEGPSLRELISENKEGLPVQHIAHIFTQIADVLIFAHAEGVLHRDLKPDNILLTESKDDDQIYKAIVTDFGLVKIANGSITETQEGVSLGTPAYMSPEQCRGAEVDGRTDIYALGVMLYEAITGKRPYPIRNLFDAVKFHGSGNFVGPRAHNPSIPLQLDILVRRMMSPDVDKRPATAAEVVEKLSRFLQKTGEVDPFSSNIIDRIASGAHKIPQSTAEGLDSRDTRREDKAEWCVVVTYRDEVERIYPLPQSRTVYTIGRQHTCDIVLDRPERYVSKSHCAIELKNNSIYLRDLGSTNGTYLGSNKLTPNVDYEWDQHTDINLGSFRLSLRPQGQGAEGGEFSSDNDSTIVHGHYAVVCPDGIPNRVPIKDFPILVGRVPGCEMVLNNTRVSKRHCRIERGANGITVTDLNSTNGTYLHEQRLPPNTPTPWNNETLRIGTYVLRLEM